MPHWQGINIDPGIRLAQQVEHLPAQGHSETGYGIMRKTCVYKLSGGESLVAHQITVAGSTVYKDPQLQETEVFLVVQGAHVARFGFSG